MGQEISLFPRASALGTAAMLFESNEPFGDKAQERVWAVAEAASLWIGVRETIPGMNNLTVVFDPFELSSSALTQRVNQVWVQAGKVDRSGKTVELDVVYGGQFGPDLKEVADLTGLSVQRVVELHSAALYAVYFLGAHPGFGYLAGLDPQIHVPRRSEPRLTVPAGSVAIGGSQTGAIAQTSPSGWQIIGRCDSPFFDVSRIPAAMLSPGDRVRFRVLRIEPC